MKKYLLVILSILFLTSCSVEHKFKGAVDKKTKEFSHVLIGSDVFIAVIDGHLQRDGEWVVTGRANPDNNLIAVDAGLGEYTFARNVIHELSHIQFKDIKNGCDLPIPEMSDHINRDDCDERIAIWFEWYVFDKEYLLEHYPGIVAFFDPLVRNWSG